ncbi:MAG: hypothetical protein M5R42_14100 [Rhodocyclaceae bacterium]|nr:hypothetical protein [Rhodocyclaceae bacterium]
MKVSRWNTAGRSGPHAAAPAVLEGTARFLDVSGVMLLEGPADVRLEQPLAVGAGEQPRIDGRFPFLVDLENLRFAGADAVSVQVLDEAANDVGDIGLVLRAVLENADARLVGVRQAFVEFRFRVRKCYRVIP